MAAGTGQARPFPLQPLLEATSVPLTGLPRRLGTSTTTVRRAATTGLTEAQADQWSVKLGLHPGTIWSAWWEPTGSGCGGPLGGHERADVAVEA